MPPGIPIQLDVLATHLTRQDAAVAQGCVPLVNLKGDSYRLKGKDLGFPPPAKSAELG